jgi:DNA polymerase-3 subunit gamma/tau
MTIPNLFGDDLPIVAPSRPAAAQTQSLYRKYRPQSFDSSDLVGQEHIVRTLRNAIQLNRVAHAYLFCGPRGTGKTTTARLLAKAVNCLESDVMQRPCNVCVNCRAISEGATADVIEIDAASNRGIDDIRDLRERVKYSPNQLQTKFYIIDEAHQITGAAANAFLKTLEEPPAHTKFVLATTDPEELLQTIVSRCQRFDFRRIGLEATVNRLRRVADAEGLAATEEALQTIARHATGSLRDALGLLDQLAVYGDGEGNESTDQTITVESVLALLGVSHNDRVERLVNAIADRDAGAALGAVTEAVEAGEDPRQLNRQLVSYLRMLMHERAGGSPDADGRAKELAARFELPTLGRLASIFSETDYKIRHSPYAQLPLEIALVEAIVGSHRGLEASIPAGENSPSVNEPAQAYPTDEALLSTPPSSTLINRVRQTGRGGHLQVVPSPESSANETRATTSRAEHRSEVSNQPDLQTGVAGSLTVDQLADLWPQIRQDVKAVNRRIEALLASIDPILVNGNQIVLAAAYDFHRKRMNEDDVRSVVEDAISRLVGLPIKIECVMRGDLPSESTASIGVVTDFAERPSPDPVSSLPQSDTAGINSNGESRENPDEQTEQERDQQRLQAAKNIFDAEEIPS